MKKHVFKFGNSSLALIIPKKWTEKSGIKPYDEIDVSEDENGSLVLSTSVAPAREASRTITKSSGTDIVLRWVGLYYRYGFSKLEIIAKDGFSEEQLKAIGTQLERYCPGFEIMRQTSNQLIIEDLTSQKGIDINKLVLRMRSMVHEEFNEIIAGNVSTIGSMEDLINRFYQLCLRYINIAQPKDMLRYYRSAELIEAIADNLQKVSYEKGIGTKGSINNALKLTQRAFELSEAGFNGDEKAMLEVISLKNEITKSLGRQGAKGGVATFIQEIITYTSYIAEFGLIHKEKNAEIMEGA
jgi:phosphate uptake regulator